MVILTHFGVSRCETSFEALFASLRINDLFYAIHCVCQSMRG